MLFKNLMLKSLKFFRIRIKRFIIVQYRKQFKHTITVLLNIVFNKIVAKE